MLLGAVHIQEFSLTYGALNLVKGQGKISKIDLFQLESSVLTAEKIVKGHQIPVSSSVFTRILKGLFFPVIGFADSRFCHCIRVQRARIRSFSDQPKPIGNQ